MARKTIDINTLILNTNERTIKSLDDQKKGIKLSYATKLWRECQQSILEDILMDTGNYNGFNCLPSYDNDNTCKLYYYIL